MEEIFDFAAINAYIKESQLQLLITALNGGKLLI